MLAIRMQRTGRKGHAQFRLIVQDSRFSPSSGRVVAFLGSYDPHAKTTVLDKEKAQAYLSNGAQPSGRAIAVLKSEGVELPKWVSEAAPRTGAIRNTEKLRRNRPVEEAPVEEAVEVPAEEALAEETPAEETTSEEVPAEDDTPAEEAASEEAPATESATEETTPEA
jgi:small subunit ribosomal protein S16